MSKLETVRLNVFQGMQNIPNFVADTKGFFSRQGICVETVFTKSSQEQRNALRSGACDIVHSAVDNAFALADESFPISIIIGLDHGFNKIVTRAGLTSYEDLRGKIFGVDAPDTAFALLGFDVLARHGLQKDRDYSVRVVGATPFRLAALKSGEVDFALLNLPFNLLALDEGCHHLDDPAAVVGAYQATCGFASKKWVEANRSLITLYCRAYVDGLRWARDPANRVELNRLALDWFKLSPEMTQQCLDLVLDAKSGFALDAQISPAGFAQTLRLRDAFEGGGRTQAAQIDESFYKAALV